MNTIKECFHAILRGDKDDSRAAARLVRKLLYSAQGNREKYGMIKDIVHSAPTEYATIAEDWRQENFVMAVSVIYFLRGKEERPDFLFPWLFELLQHPNGYIRHAAVKMFSNEIWPLTVYIRVPDYEPDSSDRLDPKQSDNILHSLFIYLNELSTSLREPKFKKYKYTDSLPTSPCKSVQMVLAELDEACAEKNILSEEIYETSNYYTLLGRISRLLLVSLG